MNTVDRNILQRLFDALKLFLFWPQTICADDEPTQQVQSEDEYVLRINQKAANIATALWWLAVAVIIRIIAALLS